MPDQTSTKSAAGSSDGSTAVAPMTRAEVQNLGALIRKQERLLKAAACLSD